MRRRTFIMLLGGVAAPSLLWPLAVRAQQRAAKVYRIGVLETTSPELNVTNLRAFRRGLLELGYNEGKDYVLEYRSADGRAERFPSLAAELVGARVDLIVTRGTPAAQAAKAATSTIPIVMAAIGEALGVIGSLAHPEGNVTGLSAFTTQLAGKRVELAKEISAGIARVAFLHNMSNPVAPPQWEETKAAARQLAMEAELLDVRSREDLPRAIDAAVSRKADALLVGNDAVTQESRSSIADLAARSRLPTVYGGREFVDAGGLMSYAASYSQLYVRAAGLVDKIIRGAKPGDLPVEQPTKFELVVNLKAAKAIGLTIPETFLARADEVIE
jgi:putative tryptophan/tyrosine transport system substrate-binding protein